MKYLRHKIQKAGHVDLWELTDDGKIHKKVIKANESIPEEYKEQIESDPDFEKYRTQENADAYEARLEAEKPTKEELDRQQAQRELHQKREQIKQELKSTRPSKSNLSKRVEKLEFIMGIHEDYTE